MWTAIECLPEQIAVSRVWRNLLPGSCDQALPFLRPLPHLPEHVPCCRCCCAHRVIHRGGDDFIAVCECESFTCADIPLVRQDIILLEFDWIRLGRAVIRALDCAPRESDLGGFYRTRQFGAFGDAVPVLLTIQHDPGAFLAAVTHIVARLSDPFVLLAPTMQFVDAAARQLLDSRRAGVFALESIVRLDEHGRLHAMKCGAELFSRFVASPPPSESNVAEQAYALIAKLQAGQPPRPPTVLSVLMMYCSENLTADQIARRCRCAKGTVVNRLKTIRRVTGMAPEALRRFSSHFERIRNSVEDSRASRISLRRAAEL